MKAHRELTSLREPTRFEHAVELCDPARLASSLGRAGSDFDWRGWVANRDGAAELVGPGVWAFWFVRLDTKDSNLDEPRADFLLRRVDGQDVRLHPHTTRHKVTRRKEAIPVWGTRGTQWGPSTNLGDQDRALASARGPSSQSAFVGMPQSDATSARDACA